MLEEHSGFNSYQLTDKQNFPTESPTPKPEEYDFVEVNMKCAQNGSERLFRTPNNEPLIREGCYQKCYETQGCEYFALGEDTEQHMGVCIGCTETAHFEDHTGFNLFQMEIKQEFPFSLQAANGKCPQKNRLFRTDDNQPLTKEECYRKCADDSECQSFTYGESSTLRNSWKGMCMGCSSDAELDKQKGFNTYFIH